MGNKQVFIYEGEKPSVFVDMLFDMQKELQAVIKENHPEQPGEDRIGAMFVALLQEFSEMLQEWRGFKYWSNNKQPNVEQQIQRESGEMETINPFLEEAVDALHFFIDIAIYLKMRPGAFTYTESQLRQYADNYFGVLSYAKAEEKHIFNGLLSIYAEIAAAGRFDGQAQKSTLKKAFLLYMALIQNVFGFKEVDIFVAYSKKHEVNMNRQKNGY